MAIGLFGIIFSGVFGRSFDEHLGRAQVAPRTLALARTERARFAGGTVPSDVPPADRPAAATAMKDGFLAGFRAVQYASAGLSFLAAALAWFALPPGVQQLRPR